MKISPFFGLLAIKTSETVIWEEKYEMYTGLICVKCERRVTVIHNAEIGNCYLCRKHITLSFYPPLTTLIRKQSCIVNHLLKVHVRNCKTIK